MEPRPHPPVYPHGELAEVLPGLFMVSGSIELGPMRISRNMVVLREGQRLVLINTVRLDERGLAAIDAMGQVSDVIRLAGFHGSDDPFYKARYGCTVHAVRGQTYFAGVDHEQGSVYFEADAFVGAEGPLPIAGASLHVFSTRPPEAVLRLPHAGGTLISGDSLQNWATTDPYFNLAGKLGMEKMGFIAPCQLGPGWIQNQEPDPAQLRAILELEFDNLLPAHGTPVLGGAREAFRPSIEAYAESATTTY